MCIIIFISRNTYSCKQILLNLFVLASIFYNFIFKAFLASIKRYSEYFRRLWNSWTCFVATEIKDRYADSFYRYTDQGQIRFKIRLQDAKLRLKYAGASAGEKTAASVSCLFRFSNTCTVHTAPKKSKPNVHIYFVIFFHKCHRFCWGCGGGRGDGV